MQEPLNIKQTVGLNIEDGRKRLKLSRRKFAEEVGVDAMLVYKWERGLHRPSDANLESVAKVLDCSYGDFFQERDAA